MDALKLDDYESGRFENLDSQFTKVDDYESGRFENLDSQHRPSLSLQNRLNVHYRRIQFTKICDPLRFEPLTFES